MSNAITIPDTYKAIEALKRDSGLSEAAAKSIVEAIKKAEVAEKSATVVDLANLRTEIYRALMLQTGVTIATITGILALFF